MHLPGPCRHQLPDGRCGATDHVVRYISGDRCPDHTPPALAGRPETVPDPDRSSEGVRRAWYLAQGRDYVPSAGTPETSTIIDSRRIATGKTRSSMHSFRAAQAAVRKDQP